jgi:beta-RFAP synthase
MRRVRTASRLHFGLLSLEAEGASWPDRQGRPALPARRFGGVGLMVERPGVVLSVAAAPGWSAEGPLAERALALARRFATGLGAAGAGLPPQRLVVERAAPEHAGLGTGTQLGLAVGRALASAAGLACGAAELAARVGRGARSALGVHGFECGGLLVDAGKGPAGGLAPLAARRDFPEGWRLVLALPGGPEGLHGAGEQQAFARLEGAGSRARTEALCRLVLLGLLPALAEADLEAFGEALYDFNARVGESFAPVQGGPYAGPRVQALVEHLRGQGVRGAGQSSWGPTVFAVVGDEGRAEHLAGQVRGRFGLGPGEVWVTRACNQGAIEESEEG